MLARPVSILRSSRASGEGLCRSEDGYGVRERMTCDGQTNSSKNAKNGIKIVSTTDDEIHRPGSGRSTSLAS